MKSVVAVSILLLTACSGIHSSTVRTGPALAAYTGPVSVRALGAPDKPELGVVQVAGPRTIDELMPEFKRKVGELGGNLGVLDSVKTSFGTLQQTQTYTYNCGTPTAPRSCLGTRTSPTEIITVQLIGRAYRL